MDTTFYLFSNSLVFAFKLCAYVYTGSAAILSEAIHSLADVLNQVCYLIIMTGFATRIKIQSIA